MDWRLLTAVTVICWGAYGIILKAVSGRLAWQLSLLCYILGYSIITILFCTFNLSQVKFTVRIEWLWALLSGTLCAIGSIAFIKAIAMAPGSVLIPIAGLFVTVSAIGCLVFLREPVTVKTIIGIGCATAAVVLLGR